MKMNLLLSQLTAACPLLENNRYGFTAGGWMSWQAVISK